MFNFLRRVVGYTNRKNHVIETIMKKMIQQAAFDAEFGARERVCGQAENSWRRIWFRACRTQNDVRIPEKWIRDEHGCEFLKLIADFDITEWTKLDGAERIFLTGDVHEKDDGGITYDLTWSRAAMRESIRLQGEAIALKHASTLNGQLPTQPRTKKLCLFDKKSPKK